MRSIQHKINYNLKYLFSAVFLLSIFTMTLTSSCKKNNPFGTEALDFSSDTLVFDTVFTTIGTTTKNFKFYNKDIKRINISSIELEGGTASPFRINVDGLSGTSFSDIEMEGKDSLFVFVEATLSVNNQSLPMVVEDRIKFVTNGKTQYVQLVIWGQDAYFHYTNFEQNIVDTNEGTWPNDKPHVIYNYAFVDSAKTLNIQPNTKVYLHKNSMLQVYKGTLNINGQFGSEVTFEGDRLEADYDDVSGQYYGIYFNKALPSTINYLNLKNGTAGVHVFSEDPANSGNTLEIRNSKIENCARYGLFIFDGAKVKAENCVFAKNEFHSLFVLGGGDFDINHCDLLGYSNAGNQTPAVGISNYYVQNGTAFVGAINQGKIVNSVIYGNEEREIVFDTLSGNTLNFQIQNNLIKKAETENNSIFMNNVYNQDPVFISIEESNFDWYSTSPLKAIGNQSLGNPIVTIDIRQGNRGATPDAGAYEN